MKMLFFELTMLTTQKSNEDFSKKFISPVGDFTLMPVDLTYA